ncbi:response regulator receiver protein [Sinimarinibacterium sp. CAU 1509]|uniref:AbiTii domain-containing protein n=1 Tax=Sinimarinibacterium sp. CAU 1509 TaxID=2562283 RepID=UPI0010AC61E0|nr:response regulator receiver protein [Sinimarinibacterium sp. CAU 1509]TJY59979.1 response regulator receiver protein [Sinimarinibacterium sp. CAU 1509]
MKLLDEIVDLLSDQSASLSAALLKTKILLHKLGHKELVEWVNHELNGYPEDQELPPYRLLPAQVLANLANMAYQVNAHPIPLLHLEEGYRNRLQRAEMRQSLAVLETFSSSKGGHLESAIPMEANHMLGESLSNGFMIQRAWSQISKADVVQILIQVRSRLLDFVLELREKVGDDAETLTEQKKEALDAPGLFNNAIFGHNTTIVVGSHNVQNVQGQNASGDILGLAKELKRWNVPETDISDLKTAIDEDRGTPDNTEKRLGPRVRGWMTKMLAKAVDTSWQVELGVASNVLSTALMKFYGWP